jgi:hypothetical protein
MNDDEQRAALWREQQRHRLAYQAQLWHDLRGDPVAAQKLHEDWLPIEAWLMERQEPELDPEVEFDPLGISDTVNTGL